MTALDFSDLLPFLVPLLCFGGTITLTLGFLSISNRRRKVAWTEFAINTGLTYQPGRYFFLSGRVEGDYRGYPTRLFTYSSGSGNNRSTYTRLELDVTHPEGALFTLSRESWMNNVFRKIGVDDMEIGDPQFDEHFYLKSKPEEYAAHILNHDLRARLVRELQGRLGLWHGELYVTRGGLDRDVARLRNHLEMLAEIADSVEGDSNGEADALPAETQWGFGWDDEEDQKLDSALAAPRPSGGSSRSLAWVIIIVTMGGMCALVVFGCTLAFITSNLS